MFWSSKRKNRVEEPDISEDSFIQRLRDVEFNRAKDSITVSEHTMVEDLSEEDFTLLANLVEEHKEYRKNAPKKVETAKKSVKRQQTCAWKTLPGSKRI